jgi:DNA recombination protein RmuC
VVDELKQNHEAFVREQDRRHQASTEALEKRFTDTIKALREQVENTTNTMLKQRQEEFSDASTRNIDSIVKPLKETIDKMKEEMAKNSTVQTTMSAEIKTNMEHMIRQSIEAQKSAEELTRAFKHESKTQGDWGEVVLSNLLKKQGFTEGKDFETQVVMRDEDGNTIRPDEGENLRPDVLLHLDDKRDVIIDSKVSMTAYIDYANAEDELTRRHFLKEHINSLKKHVDELSAKNYTQYQINPHLDFVIMFVPQSPALWVALNEDNSLWQDAMQKKVFIADEQTLYAALRIIRITWTHIDQEQNHKRLYELAQEMIERTGNFLKEYDTIGESLQDALDAFESSRKKLLPGGRSIGTTANQILKLGIDNMKVSKGKKGAAIIPTDYIDNSLMIPSDEPEAE